MRTSHRLTLLALLFLICRLAAGVETVTIPSQDGKLQLPGYWFPVNAAEPRPAVILLHGCDGTLNDKGQLTRNRIRMAEFLNVEKMHALVVDSFTPRGEKSICSIPFTQRRIHYTDRRNDVYAAIQWLAKLPSVDKNRIAIVGYSHGGGTVLSVMDRTDKAVQAQPLQPKAAVAYYPPCEQFVKMWNYEISAPLLIMIGESDDWTPSRHCVNLRDKVRRAQPDASLELILYPNSYHAFDSPGPVQLRTGLNTPTGTAMVGGNPEAREKSYQRMFDFLSAQLNTPLRLTHEERLKGHRYSVPEASGFARIDDVAAVPLNEKGRERYQHYLGLPSPKAFVVTEKGGWYMSSDDSEAMRTVLTSCQKACWLYAVDGRVVWQADVAGRVDLAKLQRKVP